MAKKTSTTETATARKTPERRSPAQVLRDASADIYRCLPKMASAGIVCSPLTQAAEVLQAMAQEYETRAQPKGTA